MKVDLNKCNLGVILILMACCLGIVSLFMTWVDAGIIEVSGFHQRGYLLLILYVYPFYKSIKGEAINKKIGLSCGVIASISGVLFLYSKSISFFGQRINMAGTGLYLFIVTSVLLTIGVFKYENKIE